MRRSIFSKILVLVISVSFILGISVFLVALRELDQDLEEALIERSKLFAQGVAKDIETGYLINILENKPLTEITSFEGTLFLWVVQPNGSIYFSDNPEMIGKIVKDNALKQTEIIVKDSIFPETGEKIKLISYPLNLGIGEDPWSLFIGVSLESISAARNRLFFVSSGLFAVVFALLVLLSFYLSKRVIKPLKELEKGVKIIGKGDLSYQIKLSTGDEIEDLSHAFNRMAKNLEQQYIFLEEEKSKTLAIIDNFSDGLLVFDKNNKLVLINPKAQYFFKLKKQNIVGKSIPELLEIVAIKPLAELLNKKVKKEIFRQKFKVEEDLTLEISTVSVIRKREELGSLVILHDITREKLIERMKNEFVSLVAHQLRTPLSAIKWITRMILDEELGEINEEQRDFLKDSYSANEKMIVLIKNLLDIAKIEEGRYIFEQSAVDIEKIIEDVIDSYKEKIKKGGLKVEFKRPRKKTPKIRIDGEKMQIAIDNLVGNAIAYTLKGGKVTVSLRAGEKKLEFSIKDSGVGISKEQQKRVFSKFFRGDNVVKIETEGNGLGLYIAKNIVEAHGGRIWFKSQVNKGSTFYFTIPVKSV